ncbi:MAG: hypothetical protein ACKVS7_12915 [Gemmatimonadaceae bacterium]
MRTRVASLALLVGVLACSDSPMAPAATEVELAPGDAASRGRDRVARVWSAADAGPGSLRAAMDAANGDPRISTIEIEKRVRRIALIGPITYTGEQSLRIDGNGAIVDGAGLPEGANGLTLNAGPRTEIDDLAVIDAPGSGIAILVPVTATGVRHISLDEVRVEGNVEHGVLINDQADYLTDPDATTNTGSEASLRVDISRSTFRANGFGFIDRDGLRVNEGGAGDLVASISATKVIGNGGDGVELDERGDGKAEFSVLFTDLLENGGFTAEDYDDGIDVDEADAGDIIGRFWFVRANDNFEQGVDLNENGAGDMKVTMFQVEGSRNAEEGIEFEEDDDVAGGGDIIATLVAVTTNGNGALDGDAGLKLREKGDGNLDARLNGIKASDNVIRGVELREDAAGSLMGSVTNVTTSRNGGEGLRFDENGDGDLVGEVSIATAVDNAEAGIHAEQQAPGAGALTVKRLSASGNPDGDVEANPAQVTVTLLP